MNDPSKHFAAFVSATPEGGLVRRYGTEEHIGQTKGEERAPRRSSIADADKSVARPNGVDPSIVVPLTHAEWQRYGNEYRRAIREGSLKERKAADWVKAEEAAHSAEVARIAALEADAAKAKAEAKAKADAEAQPTEAPTEPTTPLETPKKKGS